MVFLSSVQYEKWSGRSYNMGETENQRKKSQKLREVEWTSEQKTSHFGSENRSQKNRAIPGHAKKRCTHRGNRASWAVVAHNMRTLSDLKLKVLVAFFSWRKQKLDGLPTVGNRIDFNQFQWNTSWSRGRRDYPRKKINGKRERFFLYFWLL